MNARVQSSRKKVRLKEKRKRLRFFALGLCVVVVLSLVVAGVYALHLPEVSIRNVRVEGGVYTRADLVETLTRDSLEGTYLFVVPKRNSFFYPSETIKARIMSVFHTVQNVRVQKENLNSLVVYVMDREPVANWCTNASDDAQCYVMDENGFVFLKHDERNKPFITYTGGIVNDPLGKKYVAGRFASLQEFLASIKTVTERTPVLVSVSEHDDVSVFFEEGGEVRYVLGEQNAVLLDNIASVFASRRFKSGDVLEYADFRFGNNVYVKFLNDEE